MNIFNDREIAITVWAILFLGAALLKKDFRHSAVGFIKIALGTKLIIAFIFLIVYVASIVWVLNEIDIWTPLLLRDTIIWFVFSGIGLAFSFVSNNLDAGILKKVIIDNIKIIVILEFVINSYTYSLTVELFLIPFTAFVAGMDAIAKMDGKYSSAIKFITFIQGAFGLVVMSSAIIRAIHDYQSFETIDSILQVALVPILSVCLVPYIYLFVVYSNYEQIFVRLMYRRENKDEVANYAKWRLIKYLLLRPKKIRQFLIAHPMELLNIHTREDVDKLINSDNDGVNEIQTKPNRSKQVKQ
jgi:hypothetical protein